MVVAITGGIGCGKSTIANVLRWLGYKVYNSDKAAAYLMEHDRGLVAKIKQAFSEDIYLGSTLQRKMLASIVFESKEALVLLNSLVHPVVFKDLQNWINNNGGDNPLFVESAILFETGLINFVDKVITISAPEDLRITRVMARDNCTKEQVVSRLKAQMTDLQREQKADFTITCDDKSSTIIQLLQILKQL